MSMRFAFLNAMHQEFSNTRHEVSSFFCKNQNSNDKTKQKMLRLINLYVGRFLSVANRFLF